MTQPLLTKAIKYLVFYIALIAVLHYAKAFLIPLTFGALLAMLLLPVSGWLENKGINKGLAAILAILLLLAIVAGIGALLGWQLSGLAEDLNNIEQKVTSQIAQLKKFVSNTLGIPPEKQQQMIENGSSGMSGSAGKIVSGIVMGMGKVLINMVLVVVYIFLFLFFRSHLKRFVLKLTTIENKGRAEDIINKSQKVSQKYLTGLAIMIGCLWILYGIGFSIVGIKHAIFFAILCGLLEIIPFVGNLTGTILTLLMALTQGGGTTMVLGVLVTYMIVQFVQTYLLEPLVVGAEVNINPLFTILVLVAGEMIWGIAGMVLAIPLLGVFKIISDHIPSMQPYGYLVGEQEAQQGPTLKDKLKRVFKKKH